MFERFTDRARRTLVLAQEEARQMGHGFIGTEHLLLGLVHEGEGVAGQALQSFGITLEQVRQEVAAVLPAGNAADNIQPPFTPRSKRVLELSLREALALKHNYIGTEHLLLGLVAEGEGVGARLLNDAGATEPEVREKVLEILRSV